MSALFLTIESGNRSAHFFCQGEGVERHFKNLGLLNTLVGSYYLERRYYHFLKYSKVPNNRGVQITM